MHTFSELSLFELFSADTIEQSELEQIIISHFNHAAAVAPDVIAYPNGGDACALSLRYDDGALVAIEPGPSLTDEDIRTIKDKIGQEILTSTGIRIGVHVLFSQVPVRGAFRYRDLFQILPVPPDAPRSGQMVGEHPFLLEFTFPDTPNMMLRHVRRASREREYEPLLAVLLEYSIEGLGRIGRRRWVLPTEDVSTPWRSAYLQQMYTYPNIRLEAETFTDVAGMPALRETEPALYYSRSGIEVGRDLEIPASFSALLDRFFALPRLERERLTRAGHWFQHAHRAWIYSRSAAFTALISAVEALVPKETPTTVCETCKRAIGPGPTQRFADFVEHFSPGLPAKERRRFYGIRSALSHGGTLLHSDRTSWPTGLTPSYVEEWDDMGTTWRFVRTVLVNWLASHPTPSA